MSKTYEHIIFNPMAEGLDRAMAEVGADARLVNIVQHHVYESVAVFEVDTPEEAPITEIQGKDDV